MFEKKNLYVAVVIGLLFLLFSVQYIAFGSGTDNAHTAGSIGSGSADDNRKVLLPLVTNLDIEHSALMALYNSTNGPSWGNNTGWGVGNPCDTTWYGVNCDSGHVHWLWLVNNQLNGAIPAELGNLSGLEVLVLAENQLSGAIPAELGNLSSLEGLSLSNNQLSGAIPAELGNLSSLIWLWLDNNQLSGAIPAELGNLSRLWQLILFNNQLSGAIPAELGNLNSLEWLYLFDNPELFCWQTEKALIWAKGLEKYVGPDAVCP